MRPLSYLLFLLMALPTAAQIPQVVSPYQPGAITLSRLQVDVKIMGSRAATTFTMSFSNTTDRILEGELSLPLPEGANVNRYALDINGKMREAVPVEKQKATEVFESIERRKVDPGILEKTEGNVFRTRVYPMPAKGERSIIIGYEQELLLSKDNQLVYNLPFNYTEAINHFALNVCIEEGGTTPRIESTPLQPLELHLQKHQFTGLIQERHFTSTTPLIIIIPKDTEQLEANVQRMEGKNFFYVQTFIPPSIKNKKTPNKLTIIWDVSLSGLYRNIEKEISFLEHYLKLCPTATVELYTITNIYKRIGSFPLVNGSNPNLLDTLKHFHYDGGTNLSKIRLPESDEYLFFSDGLNSLSTGDLSFAPSPVYPITTSTKADYVSLTATAQKTGGVFINLLQHAEVAALQLISKQPLRYLGIKRNTSIEQAYPSVPVVVNNSFSLAGITTKETNSVTLQFGYGNKVAFEKTIALKLDEYNSPAWNLAKLWAQKKIAELETTYEANKEMITKLGKEYAIVTKNTSLIVLEDVMDYVRYKIEPPAELAAEYKRLVKEEADAISGIQQNNLESALTYSDELWKWWNTSFPIKKKKSHKTENSGAIHTDVITQSDTKDEGIAEPVTEVNDPTIANVRIVEEKPSTANLQEVVVTALAGKASGVSIKNESPLTLRGISHTLNSTPLYIVDGKITSLLPNKEEIKTIETLDAKTAVSLYGSKGLNGILLITTKDGAEKSDPEVIVFEKESNEAYIKVLSKASPAKRYQVYLQLRENNLLNPSFYYDVASFFIKKQDNSTGLQILTNLAELDFENHELYKTFSYKLKELKEFALAEHISRKIVQWRPQEPQSYRDLALALLENGKYQNALDTLYLAISKDYNNDIMSNYSGIEETIIMELNNLITLHKNQLNTKAINKKLVHSMPVDVRVVLNWNMNDTDIDLWVTDPKGEKCFYSNNRTAIGGRLSDDFTEGYGPEQFLLKKAMKGKYKVQVHFYGENAPKIAGKTTLMAEVYTNYGRYNQQRKLLTLQLGEEEKEGIYVGEFTF